MGSKRAHFIFRIQQKKIAIYAKAHKAIEKIKQNAYEQQIQGIIKAECLFQFYKQFSSNTLLLELLHLRMNCNNRQDRMNFKRGYPDRLDTYDYKKGRNQQRGRQFQPNSKKKVPKVQLIIEQAKQQLAQPFPNPDFLMLICFAEMTKHQKQSLSEEWRNHLTQHIENLPRLKQEMEAQLIGRQQQNVSGSCQKQSKWMEANTRDIQLEIAAASNTFEMQCRQLRSMYLKILQTNDFIDY